jgi:hypothetical protein
VDHEQLEGFKGFEEFEGFKEFEEFEEFERVGNQREPILYCRSFGNWPRLPGEAGNRGNVRIFKSYRTRFESNR